LVKKENIPEEMKPEKVIDIQKEKKELDHNELKDQKTLEIEKKKKMKK